MKRDLGFIQKIIRLYTFHTPIRKGKYRLSAIAFRLAKDMPDELLTVTQDGRRFVVNPLPHTYRNVYFLGEYEPAVTEVVSKIIKSGDICLDIGANIGWYSTLLQKLVGEKGSVHGFEPAPNAFAMLRKNVNLNSTFDNTFINNLALGDTEKDVNLHIFKDLPEGHASLSSFEYTNYDIAPSRMITLDSYLEKNGVGEVNFVKADIEGSELMMLNGAKLLFNQKIPPIWEIEMALDTTRGFGYHQNDLIKFIGEQREYDFYEIDEIKFRLRRMEKFQPNDKGANVLCVPKGHYQERLTELKIRA